MTMKSARPLVLLSLMLSGLLAPLATGAEPFARVTEPEPGLVTLEMATHTLEPVSKSGSSDAGAVIHLVSAIHIADAPFYAAMQARLGGYDTVLFEGVKPAGLDPIDPELPDAAKADATRDRLALLVEVVARYHADTGELPGSFAELLAADDPRIAAIVRSVRDDAWGNPIALAHSDTGVGPGAAREISFTSLGADGQPEGEGADADITLGTPRYHPGQGGDDAPEGIQTQLARALRVQFQLDAMDTTNPEWINADMDIAQLQRALAASGDSGKLLKMLDGESLSARIMGFVLGFVSRSPQLSSMMKLVMMDMLALVETTGVLDQQEALNKVIVEDRNAVVIEELGKTLREHPEYREIGVFYGAGHMPGLERAILDMGYEHTSTTWTTAMTVDTADTGLSEAQIKMMRGMIKGSLEPQFGK